MVSDKEHGFENIIGFQLRFLKPDWFDELSEDERRILLSSIESAMTVIYTKKMHEAWMNWCFRKSSDESGQMSIYDCNA
jgi:hypothetical protein